MAARLPYEEVVIDGDTSSDDDDAVMVVTPAQSRKRRRQSAIHDDDDEGAASQSQNNQSQPYSQPPPPLGGLNAPPANSNGKSNANDSDDDEVEIVQVSTPTSAEASRRKAKLTVVDSDDEEIETSTKSPGVAHRVNALELEPVGRLAASASAPRAVTTTSTATPLAALERESTSTGRRSSTRIERKREEKAKAGPSVRKLEFLSLENCLDQPSSSSRRAADETEDDDDDDDDEFIVDDYEEEKNDATGEDESYRRKQKQRRRTRSPPPRGFTTADDEDLDEFIVADDEVEFMDDDDEGVMDQHVSSADELDEDGGDDDAVRMTMQSREPSEWFAIYLRYLEECILDNDLDNKIRTSRRNLDYRMFEQAIHHIERAICSRRDTLRSSVVWNDAIMEHLHCATKFHSTRCTATTDCEACRRANHHATQLVQFGGFSCNSTELYRSNWMKKLRSAVRELEPMNATFELGTVCHARTLGYWQLLHAKHFWVALVDAKRQECGDGNGRIAEGERAAFYKAEFGRYKRLINIVDKFSTEAAKSVSFMPNVWKKVNAHHVHSEFLPSPALRGINGGVRRGTLDSLVSDSDENDDDGEMEDEEEEEEELEEKPALLVQQEVFSTTQREEEEADDAVDDHMKPSVRKRMRQSTLFPATSSSSTNGTPPPPRADVKHESPPATATKPVKPLDEIEAEDLVCLVCRQNQRDGAIAHGNYLHFYSCYRCAKRQHTANQGCMVCDRPIQNVLRILPLSKESRADILKHQEAA